MNRRILRPLTILTLLVAFISATAWVVSYVHAQTSPQQPSNQSKAPKRQTVREYAQEHDITVERSIHGDSDITDLSLLLKHSSAVILGHITKAEASFDVTGNEVNTTYTIEVKRVIKDVPSDAARQLGLPLPAPLVTPLKMKRPEGEVEINGHHVSFVSQARSFKLLKEGNDYIFFMNWGSEGKAYRVIGGLSGMYLVESTGRIKPLSTEKIIQDKYAGLDVESFINELLKQDSH
ncbi:MAG: hypothetical protein ABR577_06925 [Pyrinomonadaceae bacterium]